MTGFGATSTRSPRPLREAWPAYTAAILALASAAVSLYWTLGGTALLDALGGTFERLAGDRSAAALALGIVVVLVKVAGALLALALVRPWGPRIGRRLLAVPAAAASLVLVVYGGAEVLVGGSVLANVITPSGPVDEHALRWHVFFWDLWFLVWGVALGIAAWRYYRERRSSSRSTTVARA
jgi:glucan phosphoethanolaminetransferase (alkaline phosphatase superfamily)